MFGHLTRAWLFLAVVYCTCAEAVICDLRVQIQSNCLALAIWVDHLAKERFSAQRTVVFFWPLIGLFHKEQRRDSRTAGSLLPM